jgi:hypothetical protein
MGIWRLKGVRGNTEQGMCPMYNKEEGWSHILRSGNQKLEREACRQKIHKY